MPAISFRMAVHRREPNVNEALSQYRRGARFDFRPGDSPYPKTSDLFGRASRRPSLTM